MKHQNYDKRIFRFLSILNHLDAGKTISTPKIAKEFNVSLRTIQRDIELLNLTGFPLVAKDKGEYGFVEGFSLKKATLSHEEASLLSLMFEIAKSLGSSFEDSFRGILRKVLNQGGESSFYVKIPKAVRPEKDGVFHHDIEGAIETCKKVWVHYENQAGKQSEFEVAPLKLIFYEGFWYALSLRDGKGLIKLRLDGIKDLKVLTKDYAASANLRAMLDESVNVWFPENRNQKVLLEVDASVSKYFKKKQYFPLQKVVREYSDGRILLQTMVSTQQYMEVIPTIHEWLPMIKIVSPKELKAFSKKLISTYQKTLQ